MYAKKLPQQDLESVNINTTKGNLFVVCNRPEKHYNENPQDFFSIGMGGWLPAGSIKTDENWDLDKLHGGFLCDLQIHKDYQGQGLAQLLVKSRLDDIKESGLNSATTITNKDNAPINYILEKFGFKVYHKEGEWLYHELVLRKS